MSSIFEVEEWLLILVLFILLLVILLIRFEPPSPKQ